MLGSRAGPLMAILQMRMILALIGALATLSGVATALAESSQRDDIKSIILAQHFIDRRHATTWRDWTIGFARGRPFSDYSDEGTMLRGLRCASATTGPIGCHIFMAMRLFESFPHYCELSPDGHRKSGHWPRRIVCPTEIRYYGSATSTSSR
jgi:hypothetical protein